jgi:redox-sensitive bicupin YhaK (pirin superfamily)
MSKYKKINAKDLYCMGVSEKHPANTLLHFSFGTHFDPQNTNFGVLGALNDDKIIPNNGYITHPHKNMEIFSYVIDGNLTHRDSAGNHEVLSRGHVQCISAGTGITHSEFNEQDEPNHFLQIRISSEAENLPVRYDFHKFSFEDRKNKLLQIITSSQNRKRAPLYVCQDLNVFVSELTDKEANVSFTLNKNRQAYIYCFEGSANIDQFPILEERDSLKIYGHTNLELSAASDTTHFIIIEMKEENLE